MSKYRPTFEEICANRQKREEMLSLVESKREIYNNLKVICNKKNSTEEDFAALGIARIEWHDAGIENERFIANLYK
jgi:hypothetical protein